MKDFFRIERDTIGEIQVPCEALWGAQTQRSLINFDISKDQVPIKIIHALAIIKKAAALVNNQLGVLDKERTLLITKAASQIIHGHHDKQFPLKVWQTGSGTQTNMNINEVISNLASKEYGTPLGSYKPVHPNDHVNRSQSTNDVFPTAIHIATVLEIQKKLLPELDLLIKAFNQKSQDWDQIVKIGRTHLQDAVPLTLGQEASAWRDQLLKAYQRIENSLIELYPLPIGGTAVGTGLNCPKGFDQEIVKQLCLITNKPFKVATNKFELMGSHDGLVNSMSMLKMLAVTLLKIVNDIRFLSCGPKAGIAELQLPENEPGSSIMPGKINPTQCEAMAMVCTQVIALDVAVAMSGGGGHLQMNVYKPLIGFNLLESIELLSDAMRSCRTSMVEGIKPNQKNIQQYLEQSLMLVTALAPLLGYKKASEIAQKAHKKDISLRQAAIELGYVNENDFDLIVDPMLMIKPKDSVN